MCLFSIFDRGKANSIRKINVGVGELAIILIASWLADWAMGEPLSLPWNGVVKPELRYARSGLQWPQWMEEMGTARIRVPLTQERFIYPREVSLPKGTPFTRRVILTRRVLFGRATLAAIVRFPHVEH